MMAGVTGQQVHITFSGYLCLITLGPWARGFNGFLILDFQSKQQNISLCISNNCSD